MLCDIMLRDRDKKVSESMKAAGWELEMYLNRLPFLASNGDHHRPMSETHFGVVSSSGGLFSGTQDFYRRNGVDVSSVDELCSAGGGFQNLHIGDSKGISGIAPHRCGTSDPNVARSTRPINGDDCRSFQGIACDGGFAHSSPYGGLMGYAQLKAGLGSCEGSRRDGPVESYFAQEQLNAAMLSGTNYFDPVMNSLIQDASNQGSVTPCLRGGNRNFLSSQLCFDNMYSSKPLSNEQLAAGSVRNMSSLNSAHLIHSKLDMNGGSVACDTDSHNMLSCSPYSSDAMLEQCGFDYVGSVGFLNAHFSQMIQPKHELSTENVACHTSCSVPPRCVPLMKSSRKLKPFSNGDGDAFVMPEYSIHNCASRLNVSMAQPKGCRRGIAMQNLQETTLGQHGRRLCENGRSFLTSLQAPVQPPYESLADVQGDICLMAKDQYGCRFLQNKFVEGSSEDKMIIFNEIIGSVVELMVNAFGNYLVQKLLEACDEDQRLCIVRMVTKEPGELVRISLNAHGTRVVQKLIETLKTREQISLVKQALEAGFLDLTKDLNGNHVVQRCLKCFSNDDNKFIFDAAAKLCVEIGTHQHGCCVLQKCIAHSEGEHRENLIAGISANALRLAEDPFGNYVVQYVIELNIPTAAADLMLQFMGHFVRLSTQKFSSHVVEKCLMLFEEYRPKIIQELLSAPQFEQLLQDPYANYVIQSALKHAKGHLADALIAAIRPHAVLRTNPHCKKIFSQNLMKK